MASCPVNQDRNRTSLVGNFLNSQRKHNWGVLKVCIFDIYTIEEGEGGRMLANIKT